MTKANGLAVASMAAAVAWLAGCTASESGQDAGPVRVRLAVVDELLKVRVEVPAGTTVELERPGDFSLSRVDPGIAFSIRRWGRHYEKCAFVDGAKPSLDDPPVIVTPDDPVRFDVSISTFRVIHCLPPGRFKVRAVLVQEDARHVSNEVVVEVKE